MNPAIDYQSIFARAERPPEVKVEGVCSKCRHNLEDHIRGICLAFFLHNIPDCMCVSQNHANLQMEMMI